MPKTATMLEDTVAGQNPLDEEEFARGSVYSLLGALLVKAPDSDFLEQLKNIDTNGAVGQGLMPAWSLLKRVAQAADVSDLSAEYHDLFVGVGRGELMPYGSWYMAGFLHEKPLADLRRDLGSLGFERQKDVREPEDHAAALCETMSLMIAGAEAVDMQTQRAFFGNHIEPWMDRFFKDMQEAKCASFYVAVGEFGGNLMEIESRYFSI